MSEGRSSFVGREGEQRVLLAAAAAAAAGRGGLVAIAGEAGVGKTRLVEEAVARGAVPAERVLWGRAPEHEGAPPYWPWTQALRGWVGTLDDAALREALGDGAADVARLVPSVAERLPDVERADGLDPQQHRFRVFDAVAGFLRRATASAPMLLVLDDLHWADAASLLLLRAVAPELRGTGLLIVATYRDGERWRAPEALADVARLGERLLLGGLRPQEVGALVHARTGVSPTESVVRDLHRITGGNPYFVDELARLLAADGTLAKGRLGAVRLPEEVRAVVRRSLEPLGEAERRLLAVAAVLGHEFDVPLLARAAGLDGLVVLEGLGAATAARLVEEEPGALGRHRFTHALVRETLYGDLPAMERATLHRAVGLTLEAGGLGTAGDLAHHFYHAAAAGEAERAIAYAARAAREASERLGYEEAAEHLARALDCLAWCAPGDGRRVELLLGRGNALRAAGARLEARAAFQEAAQLAWAADRPRDLAAAALGFGRATSEGGAVDPGLVELLEGALDALGDTAPPLRAALLARLAMALYFSDQRERRDALSREALELARRVGEPNAVAAAAITRHFVLWGPDAPLAERLALTDEVIAQRAHPELVLEGRVWRLLDLLESGDLAGADAELDVVERVAREQRLAAYAWHACLIRAMRALLTGDFEAGARLAAEAMSRRSEGPYAMPSQFYAVQAFHWRRERGGLADMEPALRLLAEAFPAVPVWRCGLALLAVECGRPDEARATLRAFAERGFAELPRDGNFLPAVFELAEVAAALGDADAAAALLPLVEPLAERAVVIGMSAACLGSAARAVGLLAHTAGRSDAAVAAFERALLANARLGALPALAHTQLDLAAVLDARGETARASALRDEAAATAERLGMTAVTARLAASAAPVTAARRRGVFRRDGEVWTVALDGRTVRVRDARGFGYLALLLARPGREIHVLDLVATDAGVLPRAAPADDALSAGETGDAGEHLDAEARTAYRRRLAELEGEEATARAAGDAAAADALRDEAAQLARELARAVGLGGRVRRAGSPAERARINVTRAITRVLERLAALDAETAAHLRDAVHTGVFCRYEPDPRRPVDWET